MGEKFLWAVLRPGGTALFLGLSMAIEKLELGDEDLARTVLEALPAWFGRTDAREMYVEGSARLPMIIHSEKTGQTGFLSLLRHTLRHVEVFVMGVLPTRRRCGIGAQLVQAAVDWCFARDIRFLSVKTLDASVPDENYGETRAFYKAMGFELFEVLPELWGPDAPCAVFLRDLSKENRR